MGLISRVSSRTYRFRTIEVCPPKIERHQKMRNQLWALLLVILVGSSYAKVFRPPSHSHIRRQQLPDETEAENLAVYDPNLTLPSQKTQEPAPSEASEEIVSNEIPAEQQNEETDEEVAIVEEPAAVVEETAAEAAEEIPQPAEISEPQAAPSEVVLSPKKDDLMLSADGKEILSKEEAEAVKNSFVNNPDFINQLKNEAGVDADEFSAELSKDAIEVLQEKDGGYVVVLRFNKDNSPVSANDEEAFYDSQEPIDDSEESSQTEKPAELPEVIAQADTDVDVVEEADEAVEEEAEETAEEADVDVVLPVEPVEPEEPEEAAPVTVNPVVAPPVATEKAAEPEEADPEEGQAEEDAEAEAEEEADVNVEVVETEEEEAEPAPAPEE